MTAFFFLSASSVMIEQTLVVSLTHHLNVGQAPQENGTNTSIDSSIYEYSYNYKYDGAVPLTEYLNVGGTPQYNSD